MRATLLFVLLGVATADMQCTSQANAMNNNNDMYTHDQLVVYDERCYNTGSDPYGGRGCNAQGKGQAYRFCTWRGSHSTPQCPQCACAWQGLNGCGAAPPPPHSNTYYATYYDRNAYTGNGADEIDVNGQEPWHLSESQCKQRCTDDYSCDCVTFQRNSGQCWKRRNCNPQRFASQSPYNVYVKNGKQAIENSTLAVGAIAQMQCTSQANAMNNNNDMYTHDQLVVYDERCYNTGSDPYGGRGCNAQGKGQAYRFCTWRGSHSTPQCPQCACAQQGLNGCGAPAPSADPKCSKDFCNSLNNDNDKYNYDQLVIYDESCKHGGVGCNAQGKSQTCRFCTWRGSHSTPQCPQCACGLQGINGCSGMATNITMV